MNDVMRRHFGETDAKCKDCRHLISGEWRGKTYHKCELYGMSHSEATDWRLSEKACGLYNMHVKRSTWMPVIDRETLRYVEQIEGQTKMQF